MNIEQKSPEWHAARLSRVTASEVWKILPMKRKTGVSETREGYKRQLALERLTGKTVGTFTGSKETRHGDQYEAVGRLEYEMEFDVVTEQVGFIAHPTLMAGASPDSLVGRDGGIEIKCPYNLLVHVETVLSDAVPDEHKPQIMMNLWVTKRKWWDFISYNPDAPENLRLFVKRIYRDEEYIQALDREIRKFCMEVDEFAEHLKSIKCTAA